MFVKTYRRLKNLCRKIFIDWRNAGRIVAFDDTQNRVSIYIDLLKSYYFEGFDYLNYRSFRLWKLNPEQRKEYINYRKSQMLAEKLVTPEAYDIFFDKLEFNNRFSKFCKRDWIYTEGKSTQSIYDFISKHGIVIAKPIDGYGGHGIRRLSIQDNMFNVSELQKNRLILEECIENVDSIKRLAPGSLNTLRIVTMIDNKGKLNILASVLRMGNGKSHTDNYHDGGIACPIDVEKGSLKRVAYDQYMHEYTTHPYSNIEFEDYPIERFSECVDMLEEIVKTVPEARYVGWDFAITPNGIDILEGNIPPGENITQLAAGRGLWRELNEMI